MDLFELDVSLVSLSLRPLLLLWRSIRGEVSIHHVESYTKTLTRIVTASAQRQPLFVSIGTGDFLVPWLTRLYTEEDITPRGRAPSIDVLVIKRLSLPIVNQLEHSGLLEPGFYDRMMSNMRALQTNPAMKREGVRVEEREWTLLPPFHGYLYATSLLIGPWMVDEAGYLHVTN